MPLLETLIVLLIIMWALGMFTSYTAGGAIHVLLLIALVVLVVRIIQRRGG